MQPHESHSPNSLVRVYSDFLLFWVILGLVASYSIIVGIGWGVLFLKLVGFFVSADSILVDSSPFSALLGHKRKVVWLFVVSLIAYLFCNIRYDCLAGYRLKPGLKRLLVGSLVLLAALSAAALSVFGVLPIIL